MIAASAVWPCPPIGGRAPRSSGWGSDAQPAVDPTGVGAIERRRTRSAAVVVRVTVRLWSRRARRRPPGVVMTDAPEEADDAPVVPVFFVSDGTGITAETMGNALLIQFPGLTFDRTLIPFISSVDQARDVVARIDAAMDGPVAPLVFSTAVVDEVREELLRTRAPIIDFFGIHMGRVEEQLGTRGLHEARRLHGVGDAQRYN